MHTSRLAHMVLIAQSLLATAAAASGYEASPRIDAPGYCATPQVVVYYHQRTPYYEKQVDGLGGLVAGPIQQAMRNAGIDFSWQEVPA